ncbi:hypothetical protein CTZ27_29995 [Streptomyces griseocarneus]|nr:hypothetical protein CTZ27_29995 [Streptomyces griseocarneus]
MHGGSRARSTAGPSADEVSAAILTDPHIALAAAAALQRRGDAATALHHLGVLPDRAAPLRKPVSSGTLSGGPSN